MIVSAMMSSSSSHNNAMAATTVAKTIIAIVTSNYHHFFFLFSLQGATDDFRKSSAHSEALDALRDPDHQVSAIV